MPDDDDTMPSSDSPQSPRVVTDADSIDADLIEDDSDLDVLSEQEDFERDFELRDLAGTSGLWASAVHHGYLDANMNEEKPPRPRRSKKPRFLLYTPEEERTVLKKLDRRLVLFMALLYMLSFLDRSSKCFVSNAHSTLTSIYRYWKRKNSRLITRLAAELFSVRVATNWVLHCVHPLRVDDPTLSNSTSAHLHHYLRSFLGADCFAAIHKHIIPIFTCLARSPWN